MQHVDVYPVQYGWVDGECHKKQLTNFNMVRWSGHPSNGSDPATLVMDIAVSSNERRGYFWLCLWKDYGVPESVILSCADVG